MVGSFRNKILVITIIGIITVSAIAFVVIQILGGNTTENSNLKWAVNEGDEFSFSVNVEGSESVWYGAVTSYEYNWSSDNITIRIIELPEIPRPIDKDTFITDVISPVKIQCISTEIPENYTPILVSLLSKFLLPIGSWDLLDMLFDDSLPSEGNPWTNDLEFDTDYFAGNLTQSNFYFGQIRFGNYFPNWSTSRWNGWSNLETGIPESATYSKSNPMCTSSSYLAMSVMLNV